MDNQQCANTHEDSFASGKHIIYHCQHPIFWSHCCAIFGTFNKVPNLGSCNIGGVFVENTLSTMTLNWPCKEWRQHADMLVRSRLTTSRLLCMLLGSAQLATLLHATTRSALWWQESYFCHEALCHCLSRLAGLPPLALLSGTGSAKLTASRNSAKEKPPCCCICA